LKGQQDSEAWPNEIGSFKARDDTIHSARFQGRIRARDDRPHEVFLQTRRYCSSRVREVVTRDMRTSITFGTDRKLPFPVIVDYTCPWEPNDSAIGPGILYLVKEVVGEPQYAEFGPVARGADSQPIEQPWAAELRESWGAIQEHFSSHGFTKARVKNIERFFTTFPWGGLKDLSPDDLPPFRLPVFGAAEEHAAIDPSRQRVLDSVGLDPAGLLRVGFAGGNDTLVYPLAVSRPTFGKGKTLLDGTKKVSRQRKHKGE
jgi:hypothetical protein